MRTLFVSIGTIALLAGSAGAGLAQDETAPSSSGPSRHAAARRRLKQKAAVRMKVKGKRYVGQPGQFIPYEVEKFVCRPRRKMVLRLKTPHRLVEITIVENGDKSWHEYIGEVTDLSQEERDRQRLSKYVDRVTDLLPC